MTTDTTTTPRTTPIPDFLEGNPPKPHVLWVGDAGCASGFAHVTHSACDYLHLNGWDVSVLAINYYGDPIVQHQYPYPLYPCRDPTNDGHDAYGVTRLISLCRSIQPDVIVLLNDPWNIRDYLDAIDSHEQHIDDAVTALRKSGDTDRANDLSYRFPPIVPYLACDAENQPDAVALNHRRIPAAACWTQFALAQLSKYASTPIHVIPLGIDYMTYLPRDREESREHIGLNVLPYSFVIGVVGRNQPRKRLDLTLQSFSRFLDLLPSHSPAAGPYLYLHVAPTGESAFDIVPLARYYGIPEGYLRIYRPASIAQGLPPSDMPYVYSAMNVLLNTSQGEGWGLPVHEAMACGVPCVVPGWGAFGAEGWTGDNVVRVPCDHLAATAPILQRARTIGATPNVGETAKALYDLWHSTAHYRTYVKRGRQHAVKYPLNATGAGIHRLLSSVLDDIAGVESNDPDSTNATASLHPQGPQAGHQGPAKASG